jgi:hypothetical protein
MSSCALFVMVIPFVREPMQDHCPVVSPLCTIELVGLDKTPQVDTARLVCVPYLDCHYAPFWLVTAWRR